MSDERDRTDQPLPGSVSNQNAEEAEPGHGHGHGHGHGQPARRKGGHGGDEKSGGEAGEGSQSTGHPDSAG